MTRALVAPHRVVRVRVEGDETDERFDVGSLSLCTLCGHTHAAHVFGQKCAECDCLKWAGKRTIAPTDVVAASERVARYLLARGVDAVDIEENKGTGAYADDSRTIAAGIRAALTILSPAVAVGASLAVSTTPRVHERTPAPPTALPAPVAAISTALAAELSKGPRVCGIDPGSGYLGAVVAETLGGLRFVAARTDDMRTIGEDPVYLDVLTKWLRELGVERVIVEKVTSVYGPGGMVNAAKASEIATTQRIAGVIIGYLLAEGFEVETVVESTWHAAAVPGKRTKRVRVGALLPALQSAFGATWPEKSNEHVRDAAGIILGDSQKKPAPVKRVAATKMKTRAPHKSHVKRATQRDAVRRAAGCNCKGRRQHAKTCPARVSA